MTEERTFRGKSWGGAAPRSAARISKKGGALSGAAAAKPAVRRTQHERRADAETRLLNAARTLLARKGWVGMTLAQVGEAAGYSRGQATHHFGSKGALLRALTSHINRSFAQEMETAPPSPEGLQAVLGYVRVYLGRSDPKWTNTRTLLLLLAEALLENSDTADVVAEYNREMYTWLEDNLRLAAAQGEVRNDIDPGLGAEFVVGAMRGLALQRLLRGSGSDLRQIREQVVQLIEFTFAAPRGSGESVKSEKK